jgi:uncharacterized circularly permuted ATP-grasp superfamily protein
VTTVPASKPKRRNDVIFRQLDDEWVIFDPETDRLHTLNLTAALVWSHLTGENEPEAIAAEVATAFGSGVTADDVRDDVQAAIRQFHAERLLA